MPESDLEIFKQIKSDIDDRRTWEDRQATAYKLRHCQIRRRLRPYPHASDLSWPLIDTAIERLKPSFIDQVLGPEFVAGFSAKNPESSVFETEVARWFDWRVKKRSNFVKQFMYMIDTMCNGGKGFLKTYWSAEHKCVRHQSIYPTMFVVPPWTEELSEADRACHVMQVSKFHYNRIAEDQGYNADEEFVNSICGKGVEANVFTMAKELREGLGWHSKDDIIILWECYERQADNKIRVHTFSPLRPSEPVKPSFILPYRHNLIPVTQYEFEVTDVGFYSPRGVAEILVYLQSQLKVLLDTENDYMIHCNRPIWMPADDSPMTNYDNIDLVPGQVLNARLEPLQFPTPPLDFDEKQQKFRAIAEQRIGAPDYGIGDAQAAGQGKKTATEVSQLGSVKEQGTNLHAYITNESLEQTFSMQWSLELQYKGDDLSYFWRKKYKQLDPVALDDVYELSVSSSSSGFSREKQLQKMMQVGQVGRGQPYFNESEWFHKLLELVDPDLIDALYVAQPVGQAQQMQRQADELGAMEKGFQVPLNPDDTDAIHIAAIEQYKQYVQGHPQGQNIPPDTLIRVVQHEDAHIEALRQKQPQLYAQQHQQFQQIFKANKTMVMRIAQMAQQLQQARGQQQSPANGQTPQNGPPAAAPPAAGVGGLANGTGAPPQIPPRS